VANTDYAYKVSYNSLVNESIKSAIAIDCFEEVILAARSGADSARRYNEKGGAMEIVIKLHNESNTVINTPMITATLLDEAGEQIAHGSYSSQHDSPRVELAPGDYVIYSLILKIDDNRPLSERALHLASFRKIRFAVFAYGQEVGLNAAHWEEPVPSLPR
jgi:hypothetical protein